MTYTDDPRAQFSLADFFRRCGDAGRVAETLYLAKSGFATVGDIQKRPFRELRNAMTSLHVPSEMQAEFLAQLGRSSVLPSDIRSANELKL